MNAFERLWSEIGESGVMVFSTCAGGRVTSRSMSVVVIDGRFYLQTNRGYLKCRQIAENPNAALCFGRFSVEGRCRDIGKPAENEAFLAAMKKHFSDAVKRWSFIPDECVLEIEPVVIRAWIYDNDVPFIETWDISGGKYFREKQL